MFGMKGLGSDLPSMTRSEPWSNKCRIEEGWQVLRKQEHINAQPQQTRMDQMRIARVEVCSIERFATGAEEIGVTELFNDLPTPHLLQL